MGPYRSGWKCTHRKPGEIVFVVSGDVMCFQCYQRWIKENPADLPASGVDETKKT